MDVFRIEYRAGYMELNVREFFPCAQQKARKIAPLIQQYCSDEDKAKLMAELAKIADEYRMDYTLCAQNAAELPEKSKDRKRCVAQLKKLETLWKKLKKNMEIILGGTDYEK